MLRGGALPERERVAGLEDREAGRLAEEARGVADVDSILSDGADGREQDAERDEGPNPLEEIQGPGEWTPKGSIFRR